MNSKKNQMKNFNSKSFNTVCIKNNFWMAENLDVEVFSNGDTILHTEDDSIWKKACKEGIPAWCWYDNSKQNGLKFGKLYNWYAISDPRGLAPAGWKIPTDAEWLDLLSYKYLSFLTNPGAGKLLKAVTGWDKNGTDKYGFTGLPAGLRQPNGKFEFKNKLGCFWTATTYNGKGLIYILKGIDNTVGRLDVNKDTGCSVRCIKST